MRRHGTDWFSDPFPGTDEQRQNEIRRLQPGLPDDSSNRFARSQAPWSVCRKRHLKGFYRHALYRKIVILHENARQTCCGGFIICRIESVQPTSLHPQSLRATLLHALDTAPRIITIILISSVDYADRLRP